MKLIGKIKSDISHVHRWYKLKCIMPDCNHVIDEQVVKEKEKYDVIVTTEKRRDQWLNFYKNNYGRELYGDKGR